MTDAMPYHLEKGPTLGLIETYLNRADKRGVLKALRALEADDPDGVGWLETVLPELWDDEAFKKAPTGARGMREHIIKHWFGYDGTSGGPWTPGRPAPARTGNWIGYHGDVNRIVRRTFRWGLEVALGLMPDEDRPGRADPAAIELFWVCGVHWFEGWVVQRPTPHGGRLVTIIFVTPAHEGATVASSPLATSPTTRVAGLPNAVPSTEDHYEQVAFPPAAAAAGPPARPRAVDRPYATWVVTHERHNRLFPLKNNALGAAVGLPLAPPTLADYEGVGGPVVVSPSMPAGGVTYDGWIRS